MVRPATRASLPALAVLVAMGGCGGGSHGIAVPAGTQPVGGVGGVGSYPLDATRNTVRIDGADPVADAAAVSLVVYPSQTDTQRPKSVILVDENNWQAGIAAGTLAGPPLNAPILLSQPGEVPGPTAAALQQLAPAGFTSADHTQVFKIGDVAVPGGLRTTSITGSSPAQLADSVDQARDSLTAGERPKHILLVSQDDPAYAMPAAAWAARSGDPVLFVAKDSVPGPTLAALHRNRGVPTYVLGPPSVISPQVFKTLKGASPGIHAISGSDPVSNAVKFARYSDGTFGWNITDPGHGMLVANTSRPLDAAASAALAANGAYGPLLLTDSADTLPEALRGFLLDIKPGYESDPSRAVYNRAWLIGDEAAIGLGEQAEIDALAALAKVAATPTGASGATGPSGPTGSTGATTTTPPPRQPTPTTTQPTQTTTQPKKATKP